MAVVFADLVHELKTLRKGRGLFASHIDDRVGPALREICQVTDEDGPAVIRRKVSDRLWELAGDLPADLRVALLAAFAICPEARLPLYQDRVGWAATRLNRDPRTARRRIDDAIDHLAQLAIVQTSGAGQGIPAASTDMGWHTAELRVMVALDRAQPEAIEQRRIVSDQDDLTELDLAVTLAAPAEIALLDAGVFYGGSLADRGLESSSRRAFTLALPRPLARGERHDFAIQFRLPEEHSVRPYFVCVPKRQCALFDLHVRFDREALPERIWLLRAAFERDIEDPFRSGETQDIDETGEIHVTFRDLAPGLAYGIRWD